MAKNTSKKPKQEQQDEQRAKFIIQLAGLAALVALALIDASNTEFAVDRITYAIIAGIVFGVGGRDVLNYIVRR